MTTDVLATIGNTPLIVLRRFGAGLPSRIIAKLDMRNPGGTVKDRLGLALIEDAEHAGALKPGGTKATRRAGSLKNSFSKS